MATKTYLAVDVGASSGRVLGGVFDGERIRLEELHRFENGPTHAAGGMYWDLLLLWKNIKEGLKAAKAKYGDDIVSMGVDTWGVDFAFLGDDGELLGNPRHYRDPRTKGIFDDAFQIATREEIFAETGLQFLEFNSLYQLYAMRRAQSSILDAAEDFLMMPDIFHWLLTGEKGNEVTNATTTQLYNPVTKGWSKKLIDKFGLPSVFKEILPTGTNLGKLRAEVAAATGIRTAEVILPGTHDTASAVAAVPAAQSSGKTPNWCYISSGTWSLMGVETTHPVINAKCAEYNFTNEGGIGGTTRLLKNIGGLWLVQECRRIWKEAGHEYSWSELVRMSEAATPLASLIDPDHPSFSAPVNMPQAIRDFCTRTGQKPPQSEGEVIRCALESLAMRYRQVHGWLQELTGGEIDTIHIVGGGAQNTLLSQFAADSCKCRVVAGPTEATAVGNLMTQAVSLGDIGNLWESREVVRNSFAVTEFQPRNTTAWDEAYGRFLNLLNK
ncbi:rhamnulokinase [Blastopirellula sp. JC732]|uniref:Rhamnulokinase n=1 Tax=Blastopirellula sediminis TaxID=2894196 RepID=A0A9X1MLN0_9BACT|nr:rhamnulokinase family protein [Blastopirellula sediminis]MCC9607269.1 rhamnulokinase [Blastopirellula sediminis]MCC9629438.1 rhamnulokinase [Blastopirellula sediminis]